MLYYEADTILLASTLNDMATRDLTVNVTGTSFAFNILLLEEGSLKFRNFLENTEIYPCFHIS